MFYAENISKNYGSNQILNSIDFKVQDSAITSIIGPNGAGKSTLLGILSRTLSRNGGAVYIDGKDILEWNSSDLAKEISILKQSGDITTRITVRDIVEFGRYPYSQGKLNDADHLIVNNTLEYMNLIDFQNRFIDELSGGQRQRVYIASLLAQDTKYIMLDEPLNNLDMKFASDLLKLLKRFVRELNKTVIIVIHDINIASAYSDYIALLKDGEIIIYDKTANVMKPEILNSVYDLDFKIRDFDGTLITTYS